ncbi:MAG: hypothetical protein KFF50_02755, partial [Desulfatitalea sp.]|nr:hypothetical protein [Desulfatitalea sp.]
AAFGHRHRGLKGLDMKKYPEILSIAFMSLSFIFTAFPQENFGGSLLGHFGGIIGALLIAATMIYVFRKRVLKRKGKANPLSAHIYFGLIGGILVVLHSGGKLVSLIGILVFAAMLLTVMSGIVGRILLARLNRSIREQKIGLEALEASLVNIKRELDPATCPREMALAFAGPSPWEDSDDSPAPALDEEMVEKCSRFRSHAESVADKEELLQVSAKTKSLFTFWNTVHVASTCFLFAMLIVHVLTTLYYGLRWLP